jgi:ribosomal protein S27AE
MILLIVLIALIPLAVLFYVLAVQSRRKYYCPSCGEAVTVEHMHAHHCGMCGAPLKEIHSHFKDS